MQIRQRQSLLWADEVSPLVCLAWWTTPVISAPFALLVWDYCPLSNLDGHACDAVVYSDYGVG